MNLNNTLRFGTLEICLVTLRQLLVKDTRREGQKYKIQIIQSVVLSFDYDNNFIIAKQKPLENDPNGLLYDFEYKYFEGYNTNYYLIIIKNEKRVIGPMNKEEFIKQRNKYCLQ